MMMRRFVVCRMFIILISSSCFGYTSRGTHATTITPNRDHNDNWHSGTPLSLSLRSYQQCRFHAKVYQGTWRYNILVHVYDC